MLLKHADQLVKEGRYEDALKLISRARAQDPGNVYALAYEERVLSLLNEQRRRILNQGVFPSENHLLLKPVDEQITELATAPEKSRPSGHKPPPEDARARVALMLSRAYELRNRGEFDRALDEVSRAFLIDSSSPELIQLERQLWKERNISVMRIRAKQGNAVHADSSTVPPPEISPAGTRPSGTHDPDSNPTRKGLMDTVERSADDPETRSLESDRKIVQHLQRAHELLAAEKFKRALDEIACVRRINPEDPQAGKLEKLIVTKQLKSNGSTEKRAAEIREKMTFPTSMNIADLLEKAEQSRQHQDYAGALDAIAGAYRIAPGNKEIRRLELVIRREELLRHGSG